VQTPLRQNAEGYRYSIEPFLIADFLTLSPESRVLDIGTGCGIIPLLLASKSQDSQFIAAEIQPTLALLARTNIEEKGFTDRIQILEGDILETALQLRKASFDVIVSNPPYRQINTGRMNLNSEKAIARHELKLDLAKLSHIASSLLKKGGRFIIAYPPKRLADAMVQLPENDLYPSRLRFIHGTDKAPAKIFLLESLKSKQSDCSIEPPLYVYQENGLYTSHMESIYASYSHISRADRI
jgi:tRNA1Val (adenine37-N6)-methyltransferase